MKYRKPERHKRGQIAGEIFIYIMAAVIIGVIIFIGAKAIIGVMQKTCDAEKAGFKSDMESLIEKYNSYGSVNTKTMRAPCEYDTVCFVNTADINPNVIPGVYDCPESALIEGSVNDQVKQNIFVISQKRTIPIGYSDLISLDVTTYPAKCLCIPQKNGNFNIRFSGRGASTEISDGN
jgi:hypothetical protein